ncbi:MAG: tetratricopeptide repeat protein [Rhodoferax sp.]
MKQIPSVLSRAFRLVVLATTILLVPAAYADDYGTVSQLARSGKQTEALAKADAYLATNPRDPQMRFIKGVILTDSGKTDEAIAVFTQLTQDYPELPEPYNNLAVLYAARSQFDKARTALEMAVRTNPRYAIAYENLGDVYARLAAQSYDKAVQLDAATHANVDPKLALIRRMFPNPAKAGTATAVIPAASVASAPASASASEKTSAGKKP